VATPLSNRLVAFLKTPLGITLSIVLAVVAVCCCGATVLGVLVDDPDPKESQSPPSTVVPVPETASPTPTEVVTTPPVVPTTGVPVPPAPPPITTKPPAPRPTPSPKPACHPNYSVCLPIVGDLDCGEISQRNFRVIGGNDPYRLDADNDGIACEQN